MIREATEADFATLVSKGCELVANELQLKPDRKGISTVVRTAMSSKAHKIFVTDACDGVLIIVSDSFPYAEKMFGQIICFFGATDEIRTELLKTAMAWVDTRKGIQIVSYSMPIKTSVDNVLLDNNFESSGSMLVWRRYGIL